MFFGLNLYTGKIGYVIDNKPKYLLELLFTLIDKYVGTFMGITIFILCGFENCVANMFYFTISRLWSIDVIRYILVMILGNSVGSILLALGIKYGSSK
ncbi:MAG: formate/nitrite transporter family protein [Bacilli bacterium]|nr:formate/nitrite transporter family protein [Bacilli bacterium]